MTDATSFAADVLVVGAGPTGLELAVELRRHGLTVKIVDNNAGPSDKSKALGIHARTLEIFDAMGILEPFLKEGVKIHNVQVHQGGKILISLSFDELDSPFPFTICIPQSKTEQFLIEHLSKFDTNVERNISLSSLAQDAEGVTASLKNLRDNTEQSVRTRWLVGCDGAHSTTRHLLDMKFEGSQYPEVFILADVHIEGDIDEHNINMYASDLGLLAMFPFGNGRFRLIADLPPKEGEKHELEHGPTVRKVLPDPTLDEVQVIVNERGATGLVLSDPHWLAAFGLHHRQVASYQDKHVFLAGDAAHIHSPAGGQGMNTGIQDSYNLAWKMALVAKGAAKPSLLDSYHTERHAVGQGVLKMTDMLTKVNTLRNPIAKKLRNMLAPVLASQEVLQQRMRGSISELAVSYRHSPIVAEHMISLVHASPIGHPKPDEPTIGDWFEFDHGPHPGDRAPDAHFINPQTQEHSRLFDLLRHTEHQLLLFAGARTSQNIIRALIEIGNFVIDEYGKHIKAHIICGTHVANDETAWASAFLTDADLSAHHKYGAGSECLYLIRPDGYIAFRSQPAEKAALNAYLERIFIS